MNSWKSEYLRILFLPTIKESDFQLAKELIDGGYADGSYLLDRSRDNRSVRAVNWKGINSNGRIFSDELKLKIKKESLSYKVVQFCIWSGGMLVGYAIKMLSC